MKTIPHKKVRDAVNNIIQNHAFYATILLQQEIIEDNSANNPTFYVDGKRLAYNSNFADTLSFDEVKGVLVHEIFHLVLLHHVRMGKRNSNLWNKSADYVINDQLLRDGFKLPKGVLIDPRFKGMNAEEVYRILLIEQCREEQKKEQEKDSQKDNNKNPSEPENEGEEEKPATFGEIRASEDKDAEETAKIQNKQAVSMGKAAGELPSHAILEMVENSFKPKFNWREIINQAISEVTNRDYSFECPDRRFLQNGIILPDLYSKAPANIVVAIDTSGSISISEVTAMVNECRACLDLMAEDKDGASLTVIYCDAEINGIDIFEAGSDIKPNPKGGGGTNYAPVFKYIRDNDIKCDTLFYITDGYCWSFGDILPEYPVFWGLTTGCYTFKPPFGINFEFDING
jgi:predicted metal-dependent peptidase